MNLSTLFVISFIDFMLALVLVCIIATVVVNGRISHNQQTPETAYMTACGAMVMHEALPVIQNGSSVSPCPSFSGQSMLSVLPP